MEVRRQEREALLRSAFVVMGLPRGEHSQFLLLSALEAAGLAGTALDELLVATLLEEVQCVYIE